MIGNGLTEEFTILRRCLAHIRDEHEQAAGAIGTEMLKNVLRRGEDLSARRARANAHVASAQGLVAVLGLLVHC